MPADAMEESPEPLQTNIFYPLFLLNLSTYIALIGLTPGVSAYRSPVHCQPFFCFTRFRGEEQVY